MICILLVPTMIVNYLVDMPLYLNGILILVLIFYGFKFRFAEHFEKNMTVKKYFPFLEKLRDAVGDDFELIHEFNMRVTIDQALELVPKLAELKFQWVEEPVDRWGRGLHR